MISARYRNTLKKEFYKFGVPWIYEPLKIDKNPRNKKPKGHKRAQEKIVRYLIYSIIKNKGLIK